MVSQNGSAEHTSKTPRRSNKSDAKLHAALDAAKRGFTVFPIVPDGKKPAITNWQNLATTDESQIRQWWEAQPEANIGIATERYLVVDIDKGKGGVETFTSLQLSEDFPKTLVSQTWSGGAHMVYRLPPHTAVKGGVNVLGPGIDIRSHGGLIVAPGSTVGGKRYFWAADRDIAITPQWLIEKCKAPRPKSEAASVRVVAEDDAGVELAQAWLDRHAPDASEGARDNTAFRVAARLYDYGVSRETCREMLSEWSFSKCHPPMCEADIERVSESASRNRSKAIGAAHPLAPGFEPVEIADRSDIEPTAIEARLRAFANHGRLYAIRADAGAQMAMESVGEMLIEDIIHCKTMSVLIGAPNQGKTFLALDWGYHIAKGLPWAGHSVKQGAVVHLAAEASPQVNARLAALEIHYGPLGETPLFVIPCSVDFCSGKDDAAAVAALIRQIEIHCGQKVELLVVDTLNRVLSGGDENSSKDIGAVIKAVDLIREQANVHTMIIHHPGKDEGKGGRGHSSVLGGTDTEMIISKRVVSFTKQRDMPKGEPIAFKLMPVRIGLTEKGKEVFSCFVSVRGGDSPSEHEPLTPKEEKLIRALERALCTDLQRSFDCKFVANLLSTGDEKTGVVTSPNTRTLKTHLTTLTEKGWLKKPARGQWVMSLTTAD